jgi:flavin-dependent dehydrogenase
MANIEVEEDSCDVYVGSRAAGGYAWVFPKREKLANKRRIEKSAFM